MTDRLFTMTDRCNRLVDPWGAFEPHNQCTRPLWHRGTHYHSTYSEHGNTVFDHHHNIIEGVAVYGYTYNERYERIHWTVSLDRGGNAFITWRTNGDSLTTVKHLRNLSISDADPLTHLNISNGHHHYDMGPTS